MGFMGELDGFACGHLGSRRFPSSPGVFVLALSHGCCCLMRSDHSAESLHERWFCSSSARVRNTNYESFDVTGSRHANRSRKTNLLSTVSGTEERGRLVDLAPAQAISASDAIPKCLVPLMVRQL